MAKTAKPTASEQDGVSYHRASTWQVILTMMSNALSMTFYSLIGYMSYVASEGYGIVLAAAGVILTVTRVFDGVIDPFLALVMDRINTRFGKIRILMVAGWVIRTLAVLMLYVWFSGKGMGVVFFIAMYLLYIVGASICDISGLMAQAAITNDPRQRPMVGVWGTAFSYLVPMILTVVVTMVILPAHDNVYSAQMLSDTALFLVPVSFVFMVLTCVGVSCIDKPETFENVSASGEESQVSFKDMAALLKSNHPFQMYVVHCVSAKLAQQTVSQSIVTTVIFGILIGNIQFGTILSMLAMLPSIVFAVIAGKFAGKYGSKTIAIYAMASGIVVSVITLVFCGAIDMKSISTSTVPMVVFFLLTLVLNALKMCVTTADNAMRADVIDYELDRSGKYLPAVVNATYNVIDQLISSLGATVAACGLAAVGYAATAPQPDDPVTAGVKAMGLFLYFGIPALGWLAGLWSMKHYELSRERMVEIQRDIADKKDAAISEATNA